MTSPYQPAASTSWWVFVATQPEQPEIVPTFAGRHHPGGAAIIAFVFVLWAMFLGAVGGILEPERTSGRAAQPVATSR